MPAPPRLLVATYNLELSRRVDAVLALLARHPALGAADVLALQEADEAAAERVARLLGAGHVYHASARHPTTGRNFGPALVSRWPIAEDRALPLAPAPRPRSLPRIAVCATVTVRGRPIRCYNVHLSTLWETLPRGQDRQAAQVVEDAAASPDPVLVLGDLNRRGAARVFTGGGYAWHTAGIGRTHLAWSFDHVFTRGLAVRAARAEAVPEALATSDHRAVWAELELAS